jgi:hypothetical protein
VNKQKGKADKWKIVLAAFAVALLVLIPGCTTYVIPPKAPINPTTVWIIEYGYHSSLALPEDAGAVEYAYGEWKWFALNKDQRWRVFPVLFFPSQGTLGWRRLSHPPPQSTIVRQQGAKNIQSFSASADKVITLKNQLDRQISENLQTKVFNPQVDMFFVKVPKKYCGCRNCNSELAHWLEALDCRVEGGALCAKFRLRSPKLTLVQCKF